LIHHSPIPPGTFCDERYRGHRRYCALEEDEQGNMVRGTDEECYAEKYEGEDDVFDDYELYDFHRSSPSLFLEI